MRDQAEQGVRPGDAADLLAAIEGLRLGKSLGGRVDPAPVAPRGPGRPLNARLPRRRSRPIGREGSRRAVSRTSCASAPICWTTW